MISSSELGVADDTLALRVLAYARSIAPGIHDVTEQGPRDELVALLRGVASEAAQRGARHVKSQRVGAAAVEYGAASSWFTDDDRVAIRAICAAPAASPNAPIGRFPRPARVTTNLWPEHYDT